MHVPSSKLLNSYTPLQFLHWLKTSEQIEYKLPSVTYEDLITSRPTYLSDPISVQSPRSSMIVTLLRPSVS